MGWTGFQGVIGDDQATNAATTGLINILDTVEVPIVVVRSDAIIAGFNVAASDVLGLAPSDIGRASRDISVFSGLPRLEEQCGQVITSGVESRTDFRDRHTWFVVRISPYTRGDCRIDGAVLTFTNVTAFRASVDQAIYEREFTKAILNTVTDPLVVLSDDLRIQSGNRAFYATFGLSRDETQGTSLYELGNSAFDVAPLRMQLKEMLAGSHMFQPVEVDHVFTVRGDRTLTLDARTLSFRGHSERRVLVTFQDITARKQAEAAKDLRSEEELRRREAKIRRLVEANVVGIVMWTLEGEISEANEAFLQMVQYDREDIISGRVRWTDLTPPEWRDRDERALMGLKATGIFQPFEKEYLRKDGSRVPVFIGGALLEGSGNEGVAFVLDLSEQKRAEEEVLKNEERTRLMLDEALDAVVTMDADGVTTGWNKQAEVIFGWTREDAVGRPMSDMIIPAQHREAHENGLRHFLATGDGPVLNRRIEMTALARDGREFPVELTVTPLRLGQTWTFSAFIRDITERKRGEKALETAFEEIKALKDQLQSENIVLREEIDRASMFEEIVGNSHILRNLLSRVSKVAPTDSSVLITGETGTGKELIARAIHKRSRRSARAFVSVNCAAIPRDLIASELFGHEKGAFTGAAQRRLGRFELAEGGTVFLDEVGELPAETQVALLRVLQEREFERVGGSGSLRADVRVIAATNRDLDAAIAAGTFRSDLFYRLNVFPIEVPSLRERREDIPLLVEYFIDRYARKAGKRFQVVSKKSLDLLQSYPWPGNIRELQNVIERSIIVCETENFSVDESWLSRQPRASAPKSQLELSQTLAAQEKEMIEAVLRESGGRVDGPSGAAARLGMPRSTLESKIRSLKIDKKRFKSSYPS
jgi:PAS domain S-box-containing protein